MSTFAHSNILQHPIKVDCRCSANFHCKLFRVTTFLIRFFSGLFMFFRSSCCLTKTISLDISGFSLFGHPDDCFETAKIMFQEKSYHKPHGVHHYRVNYMFRKNTVRPICIPICW